MNADISQTYNKILKFGETFCLYPFIHFHLTTTKERKLCCQSHDIVDEKRIFEIRNLMLENQSANADLKLNERKQKSRCNF